MQLWFLVHGVGMGFGGTIVPTPAIISVDLTLEIAPTVELTLEIEPSPSETFDL